jgi:hypothetical protein
MEELTEHERNIIMCKELKDIEEIVDLAKEEIEKENKNITATLDYEDLKSLITLWYYYCEERMKTLDFNNEWINKSKIYDKIKYIEEIPENYTFSIITSKDIRTTIITNLKELLED